MNIALWNASGLDNLGDRLLDRVNRVELSKRMPGATFATFCPWPGSSGAHMLAITRDGSWAGEGRFDAIVIGGGAVLMGPPFSHPGLQSFFLGPHPSAFRDRCFVCWNAVCSDSQHRAPLIPLWREYVTSAARRLSYLSVRNQRTRAFLEAAGVTTEIPVVPDPAVLLGKPRAPRRPHSRLRLGVIAARSAFPPKFIDEMRDSAIPQLDQCNPDVVFMHAEPQTPPGADRALAETLARQITRDFRGADVEVVGLTNMYGDDATASCLASLIGPRARLASASDPDGADLCDWMASLDCLIASRLHHCILGLVTGTPVVAIDLYMSPVTQTSKLREFMLSARGLAAYAPAAQLIDGTCDLLQLVHSADMCRGALPDIHAELSLRANRHFDALTESLKSAAMQSTCH